MITSLDVGGAEMMLFKLLRAEARLRNGARVLALSGEGQMAAAIRGLGVPVTCLEWRPRAWRPGPWSRLRRELGAISPDVVQGWLYHGDLAALLGAVAARLRAPVVWNIRQSARLRLERAGTIAVFSALALLSRFPTHIVYNSERGARSHQKRGFSRRSWSVIPNGFDTAEFRPRPEARSWLRGQLGIGAEAILIGMFGRYTVWKDHEGFLRAAALAASQAPQLRFLLAGTGVDGDNPELAAQIAKLGLGGKVFCLGLRSDVPRLLAALDIATSCSREEGFPNVVGEAMAVGLPCVVTDAGDAARVLGECGLVTRVGDPAAWSQAWLECLRRGAAWREEMGKRARLRVEAEFSIAAVAESYVALYRDLAGAAAAPAPPRAGSGATEVSDTRI